MRMEIKEDETDMRCELGACTERAEYTIAFTGVPESAHLHVCSPCLRSLELEARRVRKGAARGECHAEQ